MRADAAPDELSERECAAAGPNAATAAAAAVRKYATGERASDDLSERECAAAGPNAATAAAAAVRKYATGERASEPWPA